MADFDLDGRLDVAISAGMSNNVIVFQGGGDGTLGAQSSYGVGNDPSALISADFNGDGKPDLAVGNYGANSVTLLLNDSH